MAKKRGGALTEAAKKMGHVGGKKGGPARADALTPTKRSAIAREGGKAKQRNK